MPVFNTGTLVPLVHLAGPADWDLLPTLCRDFLTARDRDRLRAYLAASAQSVLVEADYIDKDYRDTYANFYAKKFLDYPCRNVRLHFFRCQVPPNGIWELSKYQNDYIGNVVIRPTRINSIGRTLLDPRRISGRVGTACLTEYKVNVLGTELSVTSFPYITQDTDVTVCAHAACWMVFRYMSERYRRYAEVWPYEITQLTTDVSLGRLVPSNGLTVAQVSEIFFRFGLSPKIYHRPALVAGFPGDPTLFDRLLYYYIESGLPVVASLPSKKHAVTIFGHLSDYNKALPAGSVSNSNGYVEGLVVNDDNHLPYQLIPRAGSGAPAHPDNYVTSDIEAFVVPLYEKIYLQAEHFEQLARNVIEKSTISLGAVKSSLTPDQVVMRILLTTSRSYKRVRLRTTPSLGKIYSYTLMPKFIWVAELSTRDLYKQGKVFGEVIWDGTENAYDANGLMLVHYPDLLILNNDYQFSKTGGKYYAAPCAFGDYEVYRNNLKEIV